MARRGFVTVAVLTVGMVALASLSGCKLIANEEGATTSDGVDIFFDDESFDSDKMAADLWDEQVIPYLNGKAGDFGEVIALVAGDPDAAGERFGYRANPDGKPWTIVARLDGTIVATKLDTRAATVDIDEDGDGTADATVQIGPVIRGTVLRDSLDFVSFGDFTNQIDYAKFGKSLNTLVNDTVLNTFPRENLIGREVSVLGVFEIDPSDDRPIFTAAEIKVVEPSS